jgi:hypothetical protein
MYRILSISFFLTSFLANAQTFTEVSQSIGVNHTHIDEHIMGGGAAFFDFNNDGFQDLYITGGEYRDRLFQNNQNGTFTEVGQSMGIGFTDSVKTVGVITGDIDNDGYRDIFVTTSENHNNILLKNINGTSFVDFSTNVGFTDSSWCTSASFGDADREGLLDLYVGHYVKYYNTPFYNFMISGTLDKLYLNQSLSFIDFAVATGISENGGALSVAFTDYDNDNDVDAMVGNDFGTLYGGNALYRNEYPNPNFTNIAPSSSFYEEINAMGIAIGDYDEDLDLDYYVTNMQANLLHTNSGNQTFSEDAATSGTEVGGFVSWGTFFFDYDNDTYLDLFTASGGVMTMATPQRNVLFENQQNGTFNDVTLSNGLTDTLRSRGAIYGDIDNDGDLDLVVVNVASDSIFAENVSVYRNNTDGASNWVEIDLIGTVSNSDAFGAHIYLYAGGRTWIREINGGSSYLSQNSSVAHFGLGAISAIDSVIIHWPSGIEQLETNVPINSISTITEIDNAGIGEFDNSKYLVVYPNPAKDKIQCTVDKSFDARSISLTTVDGLEVFITPVSAGSLISIPVKNFANGVYYVNVAGSAGAIHKKVVINH